MTVVARELAKYRLHLVGVQEVRLDGNGISPIGDYMLYYELSKKLNTYKSIILPVVFYGSETWSLALR